MKEKCQETKKKNKQKRKLIIGPDDQENHTQPQNYPFHNNNILFPSCTP